MYIALVHHNQPTNQTTKKCSTFLACEAGTFGKNPATEQCMLCPAGWSSTKASILCNPCSKGKYSDELGIACKECQQNSFQEQNDIPSIECVNCPIGWKQDASGQSLCSNLNWQNIDSCSDNEYLNTSSGMSHQDAWKCIGCPQGGDCTGATTSSNLVPKLGWWKIPLLERDISLSNGDKGMFAKCFYIPACLGKLRTLNTSNNSYPPDCLNNEENKLKPQPTCAFQKCLYPHACHGKPDPERYTLKRTTVDGTNELYDPAHKDSNFTETCDETKGYSNNCTNDQGTTVRCRLCATCSSNKDKQYKRKGGSTECQLCPDRTENRILLGVGIFVMIIGTTAMIYMEITSDTSTDEISDTVKKIILNFLQIVSLASSLPLHWPQQLTDMFESFETISSSGTTLLVPDCELSYLDPADAFYSKQWFYTFLVPLIVVLCVVVWSLLYCCCKKLKRHCKDYMILSIVMLIFLCYPTLVKLSLSVSNF